MGWLDDVLQGIPLNSVLRERISLAEEKFRSLELENEKLKQQNAVLTAENISLNERLLAREAVRAFVERRGVLWKKEEDGNWLPCCPRCQVALSPVPPWLPDTLRCSACKFHAPFHPSEIEKIAASLRASGKNDLQLSCSC
jgi:hypothetical protein